MVMETLHVDPLEYYTNERKYSISLCENIQFLCVPCNQILGSNFLLETTTQELVIKINPTALMNNWACFMSDWDTKNSMPI